MTGLESLSSGSGSSAGVGSGSGLGFDWSGVWSGAQEAASSGLLDFFLRRRAFKHSQDIDEWNKEMAVENRDYQRALQEQLFEREDTAVQRRAEDLEAAGISKHLAAGSAASAGPVVGSDAPKRSQDPAARLADLAMWQDMRQRKEQIGISQAQKELTKAQIANVEADTDRRRIENAYRLRTVDTAAETMDATLAQIRQVTETSGTQAALNLVRTDTERRLADSRIDLNDAQEASARTAERIASVTGIPLAQAQAAAANASARLADSNRTLNAYRLSEINARVANINADTLVKIAQGADINRALGRSLGSQEEEWIRMFVRIVDSFGVSVGQRLGGMATEE